MWLAIVTALTWFLFTICFVDGQNTAQATREAIRAADNASLDSSTHRIRAPYSQSVRSNQQPATPALHNRDYSATDNFIKSLLYNQVPLTAFLNRRTLLAFFALLVGFLLVTFVMPFFALIRARKSFEVSIQLTVALGIFMLASLCATSLMRCIGAKNITFVSLTLATGACFILGKENLEEEEISLIDTISEASLIINYLQITTLTVLKNKKTGDNNARLRHIK